MTHSKFCMVIKLDNRKIFTGSTTPPAQVNFFVAKSKTRDLFAVANILVDLAIDLGLFHAIVGAPVAETLVQKTACAFAQ